MMDCICSPGMCCLNNFNTDGIENWERIAETNVAKKIAYQEPNISVNSTMKIEIADKKSHQIIVNLGFQRSAKVPPINEKMKIGANSATEISEMYIGWLSVISVTYSKIEKFRIHIPSCNKKFEDKIIMTIGWDNSLFRGKFDSSYAGKLTFIILNT